jgi:hypothetical protein
VWGKNVRNALRVHFFDGLHFCFYSKLILLRPVSGLPRSQLKYECFVFIIPCFQHKVQILAYCNNYSIFFICGEIRFKTGIIFSKYTQINCYSIKIMIIIQKNVKKIIAKCFQSSKHNGVSKIVYSKVWCKL